MKNRSDADTDRPRELHEHLDRLAQMRDDPAMSAVAMRGAIDLMMATLGTEPDTGPSVRDAIMKASELLRLAYGEKAIDRARLLEGRMPHSLVAKQIRAELERQS